MKVYHRCGQPLDLYGLARMLEGTLAASFVPAPAVVAIPIEVAEKLSEEMRYHWGHAGLSGGDAHQAWAALDRAIGEYESRQKMGGGGQMLKL